MKVLRSIIKAFNKFESLLLVIPMTLFAIGVINDIILRKFFGINLQFLQEAGKYIMVSSTFLGASMAVHNGKHPSMSSIVDALPPKLKYLLQLTSHLLCSGINGFAFYYACQQAVRHYEVGTLTSTLGKIPVWALYVIVPLCLLTMSVRFLMQAAMAGGRLIGRIDFEKPIKAEERVTLS